MKKTLEDKILTAMYLLLASVSLLATSFGLHKMFISASLKNNPSISVLVATAIGLVIVGIQSIGLSGLCKKNYSATNIASFSIATVISILFGMTFYGSSLGLTSQITQNKFTSMLQNSVVAINEKSTQLNYLENELVVLTQYLEQLSKSDEESYKGCYKRCKTYRTHVNQAQKWRDTITEFTNQFKDDYQALVSSELSLIAKQNLINNMVIMSSDLPLKSSVEEIKNLTRVYKIGEPGVFGNDPFIAKTAANILHTVTNYKQIDGFSLTTTTSTTNNASFQEALRIATLIILWRWEKLTLLENTLLAVGALVDGLLILTAISLFKRRNIWQSLDNELTVPPKLVELLKLYMTQLDGREIINCLNQASYKDNNVLITDKHSEELQRIGDFLASYQLAVRPNFIYLPFVPIDRVLFKVDITILSAFKQALLELELH